MTCIFVAVSYYFILRTSKICTKYYKIIIVIIIMYQLSGVSTVFRILFPYIFDIGTANRRIAAVLPKIYFIFPAVST